MRGRLRLLLFPALLVVALSAPPPTASAEALFVDRIAGRDRYATAVAASKTLFTTPLVTGNYADTVILCTGRNWPDALCAAPLCSFYDAPLLLVDTYKLPSSTEGEIRRLAPSAVIVVGGPPAVSDDVVKAVRALPSVGSVSRVDGADRYATSAAVARRIFAHPDYAPTSVFVATGLNYPDALAASAPAGARGEPVLLTAPDRLPASIVSALDASGAGQAFVLGSEQAVGPDVFSRLQRMFPTVTRVKGADRYATAAAVAARFAPAPAGVCVASGEGFADALVGGASGALTAEPLLLTRGRTLPGPTESYFLGRYPQIAGASVFGGESVISPMIDVALSHMIRTGTYYPIPTKLTLSLSDTSPPSGGSVTLRGKVIDQRGNPVEGARVTFFAMSEDRTLDVAFRTTATTGADGTASCVVDLEGAPRGERVNVSASVPISDLSAYTRFTVD